MTINYNNSVKNRPSRRILPTKKKKLTFVSVAITALAFRLKIKQNIDLDEF